MSCIIYVRSCPKLFSNIIFPISGLAIFLYILKPILVLINLLINLILCLFSYMYV